MNMKWIRPLPRKLTRPLSVVIIAAWAGQMGVLVNTSYLQDSVNLATDLGRYGSDAQWLGVYYRGAKVGFTVRQSVPTETGFELQEDGQLEMTLLGASTAAKIHTTARVDHSFVLRSFVFSLDPGTGPIEVAGQVDGPGPDDARTWRLNIDIKSSSGTRSETHELAEPPMLTLNMGRRLAAEGLAEGARHQWMMFDPATLRNQPVVLAVGRREVVRLGGAPTPAFRVDVEFAGLKTTSWVTDTGEVVREESPLGLMTVREPPERATVMAVPAQVQTDLLQASAVVPITDKSIYDTRDVLRLRVRLEGADLSSPDLQGAGQSVERNIIDVIAPRTLEPGPADTDAKRYLAPEPLIESDAPEIRAEAIKAAGDIEDARMQAERLTRYVNGLLDKKPTISLPSAREVLRTKVGDCNEHTALYVAMARALGIPSRIAVGLVYVRGAFYYHAWPEVYLDYEKDRGLWLPVDPTFNQFPADGTHLRLARGGLDKQAAILPLIGRLKMTILALVLTPGSTPILVGDSQTDASTPALPISRRNVTRWCGWRLFCSGSD